MFPYFVICFLSYGDIAPVSVPARIFAIAWILTGLVIVAIFTSVLSATLTVTVLSSEVKLYGSKVKTNTF